MRQISQSSLRSPSWQDRLSRRPASVRSTPTSDASGRTPRTRRRARKARLNPSPPCGRMIVMPPTEDPLLKRFRTMLDQIYGSRLKRVTL